MEFEEVPIDCYGFEIGVYKTDYLVMDLLVGAEERKWADAPDLHVARNIGHNIVVFKTARAEGGIFNAKLENPIS